MYSLALQYIHREIRYTVGFQNMDSYRTISLKKNKKKTFFAIYSIFNFGVIFMSYFKVCNIKTAPHCAPLGL